MKEEPTSNPIAADNKQVGFPSSAKQPIFIVIIATLIAINGLLFYQNSQLKKQVSLLSEVNEPPPVISPYPTASLPIPSPTVSEAKESKPTPSAIPNISQKKLTYTLPQGWQTIMDSTGILEVGYDASRYEATANKSNQIDLSGKWVNQDGAPHRLGWNRIIYLSSYGGGSRHQELYKILGISGTSTNWKSPDYSEREYLYNGWSCLVMNGVDISQYPVVWVYCPMSSKEALVIALDGPDWTEIEQQVSAIKISK